MNGTAPRNPAGFHRGFWRRLLFYYVLFIILGLQGLFLLFQAGNDFDPFWTILALTIFVPWPAMALGLWLDRDRLHTFALTPWWYWMVGFGLFGVWTGSYFLVGLVTDPTRVRLIPDTLDRFIPHEPAWVFLYLTVYFVFLLPFLYVRNVAILHRLGVGLLVLLTISYGVFLSMPVAYDRPRLDGPASNLAVWTLAIVYGQDPPWNCLPSTHCAVALIAALAVFEEDRKLGSWALLSALAIGVSTLYTKQHYIADALAGYALAGLAFWALRWVWRNPERIPVPIPDAARRLIESDTPAPTAVEARPEEERPAS